MDIVMKLDPYDRHWIYVVVNAGEFDLERSVQLPLDPFYEPEWLPVGAAVDDREEFRFKSHPLPE